MNDSIEFFGAYTPQGQKVNATSDRMAAIAMLEAHAGQDASLRMNGDEYELHTHEDQVGVNLVRIGCDRSLDEPDPIVRLAFEELHDGAGRLDHYYLRLDHESAALLRYALQEYHSLPLADAKAVLHERLGHLARLAYRQSTSVDVDEAMRVYEYQPHMEEWVRGRIAELGVDAARERIRQRLPLQTDDEYLEKLRAEWQPLIEAFRQRDIHIELVHTGGGMTAFSFTLPDKWYALLSGEDGEVPTEVTKADGQWTLGIYSPADGRDGDGWFVHVPIPAGATPEAIVESLAAEFAPLLRRLGASGLSPVLQELAALGEPPPRVLRAVGPPRPQLAADMHGREGEQGGGGECA